MLFLFTNSGRVTALRIALGVALALAGALTGHVLVIVAAALVLGTIAIRSVCASDGVATLSRRS